VVAETSTSSPSTRMAIPWQGLEDVSFVTREPRGWIYGT
jgi:hypothetical protein